MPRARGHGPADADVRDRSSRHRRSARPRGRRDPRRSSRRSRPASRARRTTSPAPRAGRPARTPRRGSSPTRRGTTLRRVYALVPVVGGPAVGVLDVYLHHPEPGVAHVGAAALPRVVPGLGYGKETTAAFEERSALRKSRRSGSRWATRTRRARAFWERIGFAEMGRARPRRDGVREESRLASQRKTARRTSPPPPPQAGIVDAATA